MSGENKKSSGLFRTAAFMTVITLSAKVLGLLRDVLLASCYGTSSTEAIAYDVASRLPIIIFDFVIGGVITASFIPIFNELLVKKGKKEALGFAGSYVSVIMFITTLLTVLGMVFAEPLVSFLAPDVSIEAEALAAGLSRVMFPMIIFTGVAFSFVGLLQSFESFLLPALISFVSNVIMVAYLLLFNDRFGIWGVAVSMLVGWGAQVLVQLPAALKKGFRFSLRLDLRSKYIKRAFIMALPILVSSWVQPFCNLINTRFASSIENGSAIPAMGYANRLYLIIVGVFTFVATNLLFPYFSKTEASGDKEKNEELTRSSVSVLLLVILPITLGIFTLSTPIVEVIYMRNNFGADAAQMTASALGFFALGMPFYALNEVCIKKFFSEQKTLTPMITAVLSIACDIGFVMLLAKRMGIAGIALSSSLAVALNAILNYLLRLKGGDKMLRAGDFFNIFKMLLSALLMAFAVEIVKGYVPAGALGLCVSILVGAFVYFVGCLLLREKMLCGFLSGAVKRREN